MEKTGRGQKRKICLDQSDATSGSKKKRQNGLDQKINRVVTDINVEGFAESRSVEIQAMTEVVKNVGGNHMAFQKLPRHMRRRAMSHNIKRVPRRLHQAVKSELEKTKSPSKCPSRRYRRRPKNLLAEYERRKRKIGWLETHIWHAKRFKMVERWNYRLALHPNEKSIRACYRAVRTHCLMQDVSYESYIEIKGAREKILDGLSHLTSNKTGPTFAAKMTSSGTRQGKLTLYTYDGYPFSPIGQVTYLWQADKREQEGGDNCSVLWICCHPSFYAQALDEINRCLSKIFLPDIDETRSSSPEVGSGQKEVKVIPLKDQLVKFRLYGPASNRVLSEVLQISNIGIGDTQNGGWARTDDFVKPESVNKTGEELLQKNEALVTKDADGEVRSGYDRPWWKNFYSSRRNIESFKEQGDLWSKLRMCHSPAEAPSDCVLALTVRDPRMLLPPKRNKVSTVNSGSTLNCLPLELFTAGVACSPLWDAEIREETKTSKISEHKLNEMKSQKLVPGCPLQLGDQESRIPVILLQRPGASSFMSSSCLGYASGWDIILPSGWAMAFWVALVYRGARVGGMREARSTALQAGLLFDPHDFPDSSAGIEHMKREAETLQSRYNRRPPAKRPNYTKLGFLSPFIFDFDKLVREWNNKIQSELGKLENSNLEADKLLLTNRNSGFYVLRDRKCLRLLNMALTDARGFLKPKDRSNGKMKSNSSVLENLASTVSKEVTQQHSLALVPVLLSILHRGIPAMLGHICLPTEEDLLKLNKDKSYGGPEEMKHRDPEESFRKDERKRRLKLRKQKKRGKGRRSDNAQSASATSNEVTTETKLTDIDGNRDKINFCNKEITDVALLDYNSHVVCGFVNSGDFDLGKGHGTGIGFCSVAALLRLLEQQGNRKSCIVLVRNPTSFQYRFASISVVI